EQNRLDVEDEACRSLKQGSDGDLYVGSVDTQSVMNYCSPQWNNEGRLTAKDIIGVRSVYAPQINPEFCSAFSNLIELEESETGGENVDHSDHFIIDLSQDMQF